MRIFGRNIGWSRLTRRPRSVSKPRCRQSSKKLYPQYDFAKDPVTFLISDTNDINAWHLGKGDAGSDRDIIAFTKGMLNFVENEDQLVDVLGHESGHWAASKALGKRKNSHAEEHWIGDMSGLRMTQAAGYAPEEGLKLQRRLMEHAAAEAAKDAEKNGPPSERMGLLQDLVAAVDEHGTDESREENIKAGLMYLKGQKDLKRETTPFTERDLFLQAKHTHIMPAHAHAHQISMGTAGMAMTAYSIGNKFLGNDATYSADTKSGDQVRKNYAQASLTADGTSIVVDSADMAHTIQQARHASSVAKATSSTTTVAATETLEIVAENAGRLAKVGKFVGKAAGPLGIVLSTGAAVFEYKAAGRAGNGYRQAEAIGGAAGGMALGMAGGILGSMATGALIGTAIPIPFLGTAMGCVVGLGAGLIGAMGGSAIAKHAFGDKLQDNLDQEMLAERNHSMQQANKITQQSKKLNDGYVAAKDHLEKAILSHDPEAIAKAKDVFAKSSQAISQLKPMSAAEAKIVLQTKGKLEQQLAAQNAVEVPESDKEATMRHKQMLHQLQKDVAALGGSLAMNDAFTKNSGQIHAQIQQESSQLLAQADQITGQGLQDLFHKHKDQLAAHGAIINATQHASTHSVIPKQKAQTSVSLG